jgi:hypothetical protein
MKVLNQEFGPDWAMYNGDCVSVIGNMPDSTI